VEREGLWRAGGVESGARGCGELGEWKVVRGVVDSWGSGSGARRGEGGQRDWKNKTYLEDLFINPYSSTQLSYRSTCLHLSYRTDRVEIVRTFQCDDSVNDHFEREPYSVLVRARETRRGQVLILWFPDWNETKSGE